MQKNTVSQKRSPVSSTLRAVGDGRVHWLIPAMMVGAVLLGTIFAIGHHVFYGSLAGHQPPSAVYNLAGSHVSGQELNIAAGTTFALLVRSALIFALTLSYIQLVWHAAKLPVKELTVADMDTMLSAPGNLLVFFNIFAWRRWPLVLLTAALSWILPIATVVTPATLTVGQTTPPVQSIHVPSIAFTGANMATVANYMDGRNITIPTLSVNDPISESQIRFNYEGPSLAVSLIAGIVAAQGSVIPVVPPTQNATWTVTFPGPSLSCSNVSDPLRNAMITNIVAYMDQSADVYEDQPEKAAEPLLLAWVPSVTPDFTPEDKTALQSVLPYQPQNGNGSLLFADSDFSNRKAGDLARLYIASIPAALLYQSHNYTLAMSSQDRKDIYVDHDLTLVQCDLQNATYRARLTFVNGVQTADMTVLPGSEAQFTALSVAYGRFPGSNFEPLDAYPTLPTPTLPLNCQGLWKNLGFTNCTFDTSILTTFSYQAVFDSFSSLIQGSINLELQNGTFQTDTAIGNTILARTPEVAPVINDVQFKNAYSFQYNIVNNYTDHPGLSLSYEEAPAPPLMEALEQLFQNITLSLMSSPELQPNESSPFFPPPVEVTDNTLYNVYKYSPSKLWLAYGSAIAISALTVIAGLIAMYSSNASYNNNFSSMLRLIRGARLSREIEESDYDGREPLPRYLKNAKISFAGDRSVVRGTASYEALSVQESSGGRSESTTIVAMGQSDTVQDDSQRELPEKSPGSTATSSFGRMASR